MGGVDRGFGLYLIDANVGPGSGVRIINVPPKGPFREGMRCGEQNLLMHAKELVGDRDRREHEFTVELRAFDAARNGAQLGLPALLALCSVLLGNSIKGDLIAVVGLTLEDGIEPVDDAVSVAELAAGKEPAFCWCPYRPGSACTSSPTTSRQWSTSCAIAMQEMR